MPEKITFYNPDTWTEKQVSANYADDHVFSSAPPPDLDDAHAPERSIAIPGLIGGIVGFFSGLIFQIWVSVSAYPLNFGGKPYNAFPSFIWVSFECAVLFAALSMVGAFLYQLRKNRLVEKELLLPEEEDYFGLIDNSSDKQA